MSTIFQVLVLMNRLIFLINLQGVKIYVDESFIKYHSMNCKIDGYVYLDFLCCYAKH